MKKTFFILMAMSFMSTPVVFAQSTMPESPYPLQLSIEGGGLWDDKDNSRLRDGGEVIGRVTYDVTSNIALGGESGGLRFKDDVDGVKYGYLHGVPILGDVVFKMPIAATDNRLVPYVYESAGIIFWSYHKSDAAEDAGVTARTRAHFASKPGAGLEYYLTPHVAVFIEASYLFTSKFDLKNAATTPPNGKVNVDSVYGGGGVKVAF